MVLQALRQIDLESRYLAVDSPDPSEIPYLDVDSSASSEIPIPSNVSGATLPFPEVKDTDWLVRNWRDGRREANRFGRGIRAGVRRNSEDCQLVGNSQGFVGRRPQQKLPAARSHSGLGPIAHAVGIA